MRKSFLKLSITELIVVTSVVGILAVVFMPILVSAKENRHHNPCISNLKDIRKSLTLYREDYSGKYPSTLAYRGWWPMQSDTNSPSVAGLIGLLAPYTRDMDMWMCPYGALRKYAAAYCDYPQNGRRELVGWLRFSDGTKVSTNYFSFPLNRDYNMPESCLGMTPEQAMERWGTIFSPGGIYQMYGVPEWNGRLIQDAYGMMPFWWPHESGCNFLYHDGHVAWVQDPRSIR